MQITVKFAILFAAVSYGSLSVAALPTFRQYNTRELAVDFDTRDLSYLDARNFEDFRARQVRFSWFCFVININDNGQVVTTPSTPAPIAPVSAVEQTSHPTGGSSPIAPPKLTHEEHAANRAALADPTHPNHQKALERQKVVHAYHLSALADPAHPHHSKAQAIEEKKKAFAKQHQEALNDPTHHLHKHAQAYEAQKLHKAALADPTHPNHAAAKAKEEKRKAFKKLHQEALSDPNHHLHQAAKAHEAKKMQMAALANPNHPNHQVALKEHQERIAKQQGSARAGAPESAPPHVATVGDPGAGTPQTLLRRDYY